MKIKLTKQGGKYNSVAITELSVSDFNILLVFARKGMETEAQETEQLGLAMTTILNEKVKAIREISEWREKVLAGDESVSATQDFEI